MEESRSKKALYKKLGIRDNSRILVINAPKPYRDFFSELPIELIIHDTPEGAKFDFIHIFALTTDELEAYYALAKLHLKKDGMLWVSWPKKSATLTTQLTKNIIMSYGLEHGLVDTKVASIDENWSAHKFVYRLKDR